MKLVKMPTPPIKASIILFAFLAALSARANSSFDWTGVGGVVTVPNGTSAVVLDSDKSAIEALTSIVLEGANSQVDFQNTVELALKADFSGPGNGNVTCPQIKMTAATGKVTFNGNVYLKSTDNVVTYFQLGNCVINGQFGTDHNYYRLNACEGCTVEISSTARLVRRYLAYLYGSGTYKIASRFPYSTTKETFNQCNFDGAAKLVFCDADLNACNYFAFATGCVFDLNGFDQSVKCVYGGSKAASDSPNLVEVTSATPAILSAGVTQAAPDTYIAGDQKCSVVYTGAVTLDFANNPAFTNTLCNGISDTTGDLNIKSGTFALDGNALWAGPRVNVSGGRLIAKAATGSFSDETAIALSRSGVLEVPAGCIAKVKKTLLVDGMEVELNGIRKAANLAEDYPGFFAGEGAVSTMDSDPRPALSAAMSAEGLVEVEDITPGVAIDASGLVAIPAGEEMRYSWRKRSPKSTEYAFVVAVSGDATASVYVDGAFEPLDTVTAADGEKAITFVSDDTAQVKIVVLGESGSAVLSRLDNEISARIFAPQCGIEVNGAEVGTNFVAFGESLAFTITRIFDSDDRIAKGLDVNGVFVDFDVLPDATYGYTISNRTSSVVINVVYDETTLYVDDKEGSDTENSGRHPSIAFKTIKHAMGLANSGYTIVVAPGVYGDEPGDEMMGSEGDWCRVSIKSGVTLKASGAAEETVILGKEATEPFVDAKGYAKSGTDSARCVAMAANTRIEGFMLTGGCATYVNKATDGGGISAANNTTCRIVGCIISNCYATGTACAGNKGLYLRCRIEDCRNGNSYGQGLRAGACAYNCLFKDQSDALSTCTEVYYSTFLTGTARPVHSHGKNIFGCVFTGASAPGQDTKNCTTPASNSLFRANSTTMYVPSLYDPKSCRIEQAADQKIGSDGAPLEGSPAIDLGTTWEEYLAMMLNAGWTEEDAVVDLAGNPRCLNGLVDAGCYEYGCGAMSQALDELGFAKVVWATLDVSIGADGHSLTMPGGNSLTVDWAPSVAVGNVEYSFTAEVSETAVLRAYLGDSKEPYAVLTAAEGKQTLSVAREGGVTVRIEVDGEGAATVSRFDNVIYAIITAEKAGVQLTGDATLGTNFVASGAFITFTVSRKFDSSECLAVGLLVNGEFVSFEGLPDGIAFTVDSKATSVRIDVVYAESLTDVYVDDRNGSDTANFGRHPNNALKTIKAAFGLAKKSGDIVYVAPGVYGDEPDDEVMGELKFKAGSVSQQISPFGFSRILIPAGVTVKATGAPEETVIVGRKATEVLSGGGCGADSARCAFLEGGARLIGFTLTGGYSTTITSSASAAAGASDGGAAYSVTSAYGSLIDCIITNNVASNTGGSGYGLHYFGCYISGNSAVQTYGQGARYGYLFNCRLKETSKIGGAVSVCSALVNCTIDCPNGSTGIHSADYNVYNSIFTGGYVAPALYTTTSTSTGTYYNCVFTAPPDAKAWTNEACHVVTVAELDLDENGVPRKGSAAVDAGDYAWYASKLSEYPDLKDRGLLGCQRVYNGAIDIGAGEFDWRDTYRDDLGKAKWLAVEAASSTVVETAGGAVRLADGSELTLKFTIARLDGEKFVDIPFVRSGAGTLTATLDGAAIEPKDGAFVLKATAAEQTLVLSYSGEGYADFTKMRRNSGIVLIVR